MNKARIFTAYAREDKQLFQAYWQQLQSLSQDGDVDAFYDGMIEPGEPWDPVLREQICSADIVVFLLSPALIASNYVMGTELPAALERYRSGKADVLPVLMRAVRLPEVFAKMQFLQSHEGNAIASSADRDMAWKGVVESIAKRVKVTKARSDAREKGISTLRLQELASILSERLRQASKVRLCSRTGVGWNRDLGGFDYLSNHGCEPQMSRFLFLDPDGKIFALDSSMHWHAVPIRGFAQSPAERRRLACSLYHDLTDIGVQVRVIDVVLPAAFWTLESAGNRSSASAYIEVAVWRALHDGNLYIEANGAEDRHVMVYSEFFDTLWDQAREWPRASRSECGQVVS